jgi:anti-sigma factor RsiW
MVTDYLEGALSGEERAVLEHHLADCDSCVTYVAQLEETIRLAGTLSEGDVPSPVMDVLGEVFRRCTAGRSSSAL